MMQSACIRRVVMFMTSISSNCKPLTSHALVSLQDTMEARQLQRQLLMKQVVSKTICFLAKGAKVMITHNIWQTQGVLSYALELFSSILQISECHISWIHIGLLTPQLGFVGDVVWPIGSSRSESPLALLVSCKNYTGPTL